MQTGIDRSVAAHALTAMTRLFALAGVSAILLAPACTNASQASNKPSAVEPQRCAWARGWAAATRGGRGGRIERVTTLAASGPGSLAAALAQQGARLIVFEVGGVIDL